MKNKSRSKQALRAAHMSALKVTAIFLLVSYPLVLVGESVLDSRKGVSGWIYLLAGLISCAVGIAVAQLYSSRYGGLAALIRANYQGLSIVGVMLKKAQDATVVSVGLLFAALLVLAVARGLKEIEVHPYIVLVLLLVALVGTLRVQLLRLRIKSGLFGSTEAEAREIIRFIIESSNSSDLDDDGKRRPLITDRDMEDIRRRVGQLAAIEARG